jgi:hypothetical protein
VGGNLGHNLLMEGHKHPFFFKIICTDDPFTKLHVNGKMTINTGNSEVAPPSFGSSGGIGDRTSFWNGTPTSQPYSLGIDNSTL